MRIVTIRIYRIFMLFRNGNLGLALYMVHGRTLNPCTNGQNNYPIIKRLGERTENETH
jgi:hypothetical protein